MCCRERKLCSMTEILQEIGGEQAADWRLEAMIRCVLQRGPRGARKEKWLRGQPRLPARPQQAKSMMRGREFPAQKTTKGK